MTFGLIEDPVSRAERIALARRCTADLDLPIPAVVDEMDDAVSLAYGGWPERLYLIDRDGKVVYAGADGPFGFFPDELAAAIEKELGEPKPGEGRPAERKPGERRR